MKLEAEEGVIDGARAEADQFASQSRERVEALQREEQALRELIAERRSEFADMLHSARSGWRRRACRGRGGRARTDDGLRSRITDA